MEYAIKEKPLVLRDADTDRERHERNLRRYFESSYKVFLARMEQFMEEEDPLGEEEKKEIRFMVEALIEAKQLLARHE